MAWLASRARATHVNPFCTPEEAESLKNKQRDKARTLEIVKEV